MTNQIIVTAGFAVICAVLLGFGVLVLWMIFMNRIRLDGLLLEPPAPGETTRTAKASLSRFQFLIFTFVIAGLYLLLSIEAGTFVEIPTNVLGLLGISGGTFLISKAVGMPRKPNPDPDADIREGKGTS